MYLVADGYICDLYLLALSLAAYEFLLKIQKLTIVR